MKKDLVEILYDNKKIVIILLVIVILIIIGIFLFRDFKDNNQDEEIVKISLNLFGSDITIKQNEEYIEPGYYAVDSNGVLKTDLVIVDNKVDTKNPGVYTIRYKIGDIEKVRTVTVLKDDTISSDPSELVFNLKGLETITLSLGSEYIEPGYTVTEDLKDEVKVIGEVDTSTPGTYILRYLINSEGLNQELTRTVIVLDDKIDLNVEYDDNYSNSKISVRVNADSNDFLMIVLPNMVVVNNKSTTYDITSNGTYLFKAYTNSGKMVTKTITITKIDKSLPFGYCSAYITSTNTTINVNASDDLSGIKNYLYYSNNNLISNTTSNTFTSNSKLENIKVRVYDNANNYKDISCNVTDNSEVSRTSNKLILIGDSRTEDMCKKSYCNACSGDKVFAKSSMGYSWFVNTAISNTNEYLNANPNESYNIFILMGVNGIGSSSSDGKNTANKYYNKVFDLAKTTWKNHYIYYVSVNPIITSSSKKAAVKGFNSNMKTLIQESGLKNLKYCDTYSNLTITSSNSSDGVHYNCTTYRKIHNLLKECL